MKTFTILSAALVLLAGIAFPVRANLIWQEDFSDTSDWQIIANPNADSSTITSDGSLGTFFVQTVNNAVAFGPISGVAPFVPFDPINKSDYSMTFTVDSLTASVSYDIALDQFDSVGGYLATVGGVVPQGTFTGMDTINLGAFSFNASTAKLLPKITVHTGPDFTDQNVKFDDIHFNQIPEPSAAVLMGLGLGLVLWGRRRNRLLNIHGH